MKRLLLIFYLLFSIPVFADTMPFYIDTIPESALGVYQTDENLQLYASPDINSKIVKQFVFNYNPETMPDGMFAVLLNEKKLGYLYVSDIGDENWVEVIYDKKSGAKAWTQTKDSMQFLPWRNFYNLYGRKYGLRKTESIRI